MSKYTMVGNKLHVDGVPTTPDAALKAIHPDLRIVSAPSADGGVTICVKRLGTPTLIGVGRGRSWKSGWGVVSHALAEQTEALLKSVQELVAMAPVVKAQREKSTYVIGTVVSTVAARRAAPSDADKAIQAAAPAPVATPAADPTLLAILSKLVSNGEENLTVSKAILETLQAKKHK